MASLLSLRVNAPAFYRAMARLREIGVEAPKLVKDETRLLLKQIVKYTPPGSLAQGRAAVARDVSRAMTPLTPDVWRAKSIATAIRNKDVNSMREIVRRIPSMKDYTVEEFDPVRLHQNKRDGRGRIQRSQKVFVLDDKGWRRYAKHKQGNVGSAKAGYWPGLQAVGGEVPTWVARHGNKQGSVDASHLNHKSSPWIRIQNFNEAARSQNDQNHSIESAMKMRAKSMESKARRMIRELAKDGGLEVH